MTQLRTIFLLFIFSLPTLSFAAKAVCVAKNNQTNQIFQVIIGKASYSVAKHESQKRALLQCAQHAAKLENCYITSCYQR